MPGLVPADPSVWIVGGLFTLGVLVYAWVTDDPEPVDNADSGNYIDRHPFLDDPRDEWEEYDDQ